MISIYLIKLVKMCHENFRFVSTTHVNCAAYGAGIVEGALKSAIFPCIVTAHHTEESGQMQGVILLVRFDDAVMRREFGTH